MFKHWKIGGLLGIVFLTLSAVGQPLAAQGESMRYQLLILRENWFDLALGYDADQAFEGLRAADYSDPLFAITLEDIESYQWDWQSLTLTPTASEELIQAIGSVEYPNDIQRQLDLETSLGWGNVLNSGLYIRPFVILIDGEFAYGGIFLPAISQMAINFPVIRASLEDEQVVFNILPVHIPFVEYDPVPREALSTDDAFTQIIQSDRQSAPDFFQQAVDAWSSSDTANHFREIIRSEAIRAVIEESGKLTEETAH